MCIQIAHKLRHDRHTLLRASRGPLFKVASGQFTVAPVAASSNQEQHSEIALCSENALDWKAALVVVSMFD